MLQIGGTPGNPGGGRPASVIRARLRGALDERIHIVEQIAEGGFEASPQDRMRAIEFMGKYTLDSRTQMGVEEIRERLVRTVEMIERRTGHDLAAEMVAELRAIWTSAA